MFHLSCFPVVTLLLLALPKSVGSAGIVDHTHHYDAREWDVESPQGNPCATQRGFFGSTAKFEAYISYQYELTLKNGEYLQDTLFGSDLESRSVGEGSNIGMQGLFGAVEAGIANALLESQVFDSVCSNGVARGPYKQRGEGRKLRQRQMRAVGISSNPEDQILEGLTCRAFVNETDGPCLVVDGEFVIYLDVFEELDETMARMLETLMNDDQQLDNAHPYIQKVRYVDISSDIVSENNGEEIQQGQPGGNSATLSSSFYALLAAGAFIMVGTAVFYRRRRRAAEHDGGTTLAPNASQLQETPSLQ
ncbi:expressed unknown protein [Seminavis robusta]|uniref:Gram-positive cocci surface proteins LPxTG domain-containing protein n=1 Tax=Seminavis robusta TaxID=568900 RepID=A0A9N8HLU1_9STRA|nr:expressed unknown protein [Seminavis robusta]|eukprot:Sro841_g209520.1 n/a (306) ;mRNA; r:18107-19145